MAYINEESKDVEEKVSTKIKEQEDKMYSPENMFRSKLMDSIMIPESTATHFDFTNQESIFERIELLKSKLKLNQERMQTEEWQNKIYTRMLRKLRETKLDEI